MSRPDEAEDFLKAHPELRAIEAVITDASGVGRGKIIHPSELAGAFRNGRPLPGSILGLDITGLDVDETELVTREGDPDRILRPVAGTLSPAPWKQAPSATMLTSAYERDGTPFHADPRHALVAAVAALEEIGLTAVAAVELEFYLVDAEAARRGRPAPAAAPNGWRPRHLQACLLDDLDDFSPFLDAVREGAEAMRLPARTMLSEYAPGQFEIVLEHRADALRAADDAVLFKRLVKGMAARHGMAATFMAKPFAEYSGSGMHLHASLMDRNGRNVFAGADHEAPSEALRHAVGGLLATMSDTMAVMAPNANSWRRFRPGSYAPVGPGWGIDNRTVPVRVTRGAAETRHIEHRVAGADANPYLALALVLAAIRLGLDRKLEPGAPVVGDGYAQIAASLPLSWAAALDTAAASAFFSQALGAERAAHFLQIKRAEQERYSALVPDLDYAWYLRLA